MELLVGQVILFILGIALCIESLMKKTISREIMGIVGMAFVFGPMIGFVGFVDSEVRIENRIVVGILIWILTILAYVGYELLFNASLKIRKLAVYILVVTIVGSIILILNIHYISNIEITEETAIVQSQENELVSFENVPVQSVSGSISGEISGSFLYTNGQISGSITTSDKIGRAHV